MEDSVKVAKALSDPVRQKILEMLVHSESGCCSGPRKGCCSGVCNCEIMAALGMIQSRVSYHMKELADAGLVIEEQHGKWKYYSLNRQTISEYINSLAQRLLG